MSKTPIPEPIERDAWKQRALDAEARVAELEAEAAKLRLVMRRVKDLAAQWRWEAKSETDLYTAIYSGYHFADELEREIREASK